MDSDGSHHSPPSPLSPRSRLTERPVYTSSKLDTYPRQFQDHRQSPRQSQSDFTIGDDKSTEFARIAQSSQGSSTTQFLNQDLESSLGWEPDTSCLFERRLSRQKEGRTRAHTLPKLSTVDTTAPTTAYKSASYGGYSSFTAPPSSAYGWNERGELVDIESGKTYSIADELLKVQSPEQEDFANVVSASSIRPLPSAPAILQQSEFSSYERVDLANEIMASYNKHIKPGKLAEETERIDTSSRRYSDDSDTTTSNTQRKSNLYKTELCRSWEEKGSCRYGPKCQFAHSASELRPVTRHPKYKTEICKTFWESGTCPYGKRCVFIHTSTPAASDDKQGNELVTATTRAGDTCPGIVIMTKREPDVIAPRGRRGSNDFGTIGFKNVGSSSRVSSYVSGLSMPQRSSSEIDLVAYQRAVNEMSESERNQTDDWMGLFRSMQETAAANLPPRLAMTGLPSPGTSSGTSAGPRLRQSQQYTSPAPARSAMPAASNFLSLDLLGEMLHESTSSPTAKNKPSMPRTLSDDYSSYFEPQRQERRLPLPIGAERDDRYEWPCDRRG